MSKKKLLIVYTLNQTFHWFIIGLIIPVMALFQLEKGLDLFQIGINGAVWAGTIILLELPTGGLSDTIGRKKVYLISLVVMFLGTAVLLFSWDFITVALGISLFAAARALSSGSMDAWFVDEFNRIDPEGNLQKALAKVGIFIPIGIGAGSLLGGFLPMLLGRLTAQLPGFDIYSINLIVICISAIVQFFLTSILVMEHLHPYRSKGILSGFRRFPAVLSTSLIFGVKNRIILLLLFSSLGFAVGIAGLEQFWQPQLKIILGSDSQTWIFGMLAAGYFLASSAGSVIITPVCKLFKNNYTAVLFGNRLTMALLFIVLTMQGSLTGFIIFYWGLFVFNGMSNSPYLTIFNAYVPEDKRSTLLSLQSLSEQAGVLIGSLLTGYLANRFTISTGWFIVAVILGSSSILFLIIPGLKGYKISIKKK